MAKARPKKVRETTDHSTGSIPVGALIPQKHGGALRNGGTNKGGPGRPPNAIRDDFRELLATGGKRHLAQVLNGVVPLAAECEKCGHRPKRNLKIESTIRDRSQVVEILARFGIGTKDEINLISPEVRMRVQQTLAVIASRAKWDSEELLAALDEVW